MFAHDVVVNMGTKRPAGPRSSRSLSRAVLQSERLPPGSVSFRSFAAYCCLMSPLSFRAFMPGL